MVKEICCSKTTHGLLLLLERELLVANGLSIKQKSKGSIDRYKTRLQAKRYAQTCGIDYQEMSIPVAK